MHSKIIYKSGHMEGTTMKNATNSIFEMPLSMSEWKLSTRHEQNPRVTGRTD